MKKFSFTPEDGYKNDMEFPNPEGGLQAREQMQELHDQTLFFINDMIDYLNSVKGAKEIGNDIIEMCKLPDGSYAMDVAAQLMIIASKVMISQGIRECRENDKGELEYSKDGIHWRSTAGQQGPPGVGVPEGGKPGQYIIRTEFGTEWNNIQWGQLKGSLDDQIDLKEKFDDIDVKMKSKQVVVTLLASGWVGETVPYTLTITDIQEIESARTLIDMMYINQGSTTDEEYKTYTEALEVANIKPVNDQQDTGKLVLKLWGEKPTIDLPILLITGGEANAT